MPKKSSSQKSSSCQRISFAILKTTRYAFKESWVVIMCKALKKSPYELEEREVNPAKTDFGKGYSNFRRARLCLGTKRDELEGHIGRNLEYLPELGKGRL